MFGNNDRLRKELCEDGKHADATLNRLGDPEADKVVLAGIDKKYGGDPELAALAELERAEQASGSTAAPAAPADGMQTRLDRLQQLADLHDRGAPSTAEFEVEKAKILSNS